jgi:SAM-dependent methyltransferase
METRGKALLEVGCAQSAWLPYFAAEYDFHVSGLDYSEIGCATARRILKQHGVDGRILCADLFSPPGEMLGQFDAVVSLGVVEHFRDTAHCLGALRALLKPGGLLITMVPNLNGINGVIQRGINRPIYDIHVPLDAPALTAASRTAGLEVRWTDYCVFLNFCMLSFENLRSRPRLYNFIERWRWRCSKLFWIFETHSAFFLPNRWTSPYIFSVAARPADPPPRT